MAVIGPVALDMRLRRLRAPLLAALFLSAPIAAAKTAAADIEALTQTCAACHGEGGVSEIEKIPSLAGQPEFFLFDQLFYMREGVRRVPQMQDIAKNLADADIEALSKHYAAAAVRKAGPPADPALAAKGEAAAAMLRCASCHGPALHGREAVPRIAGQRVDYLLYALKTYRDGARRSADTTMTAAVRGLSDADLEALAHYAAAKE